MSYALAAHTRHLEDEGAAILECEAGIVEIEITDSHQVAVSGLDGFSVDELIMIGEVLKAARIIAEDHKDEDQT